MCSGSDYLLSTVAIRRTCFAYCVRGVRVTGIGIDFAVGKIGGRAFRCCCPSELVVAGRSSERALPTRGLLSVAPFPFAPEGI